MICMADLSVVALRGASYQFLVQRIYFFVEGEALEESGTREARERKRVAVEIEFGGRRPVAEDNPP